MTMQGQELPAVELLGVLEQVAHFDSAMPTGVTVSHQGWIFVNSRRTLEVPRFAQHSAQEEGRGEQHIVPRRPQS